MKKRSFYLSLVLMMFVVSSAMLYAEDGSKSSSPFKTTLFAKLAPCLYTVDGMTVSEKTGQIWVNVPNLSQKDANGKKICSHQGGYLVELFKDGSYKIVLCYPILERTGQTGPMGLDLGPDGNLYVCDNQYFHNKDFASRILRVVMKDGEPTGEVQVVVDRMKLANALVWYKDHMFVTDTALDLEDPNSKEWIGCGGVWMFDQDEVLNAGKDGNKTIVLDRADKDPHMLVTKYVQKFGRGDDGGADGMTVDTNTGVIYFGHFGDGQMFAIYPDENGNYKKENTLCIYDPVDPQGKGGDPLFQCCDGIFYDKQSDLIFINDSMFNAIRYFAPVPKGGKADIKILAMNGDTDGNDGSMDQPCECVVVDGKMIIANFDWPFPGLVNTKTDLPGTISTIDISSLKKKK